MQLLASRGQARKIEFFKPNLSCGIRLPPITHDRGPLYTPPPPPPPLKLTDQSFPNTSITVGPDTGNGFGRGEKGEQRVCVCMCVWKGAFCDESSTWVICLSAGAGRLILLIIRAWCCGLKMKYLWMAGKPVCCYGKPSFTGSRWSGLTAECHSEGDLMFAVAVKI